MGVSHSSTSHSLSLLQARNTQHIDCLFTQYPGIPYNLLGHRQQGLLSKYWTINQPIGSLCLPTMRMRDQSWPFNVESQKTSCNSLLDYGCWLLESEVLSLSEWSIPPNQFHISFHIIYDLPTSTQHLGTYTVMEILIQWFYNILPKHRSTCIKY